MHPWIRPRLDLPASATSGLSVKTGLVRAIKTGAPVTVTANKGHKGPSGSATVTVN